MEWGDLFEVIVALGIVLAGLLGSGKKKKKTPPARQPAPPRKPSPPPPARPRRTPDHAVPRWDEHQATSSDRLLADLAEQLQKARGEVVVPGMPEAISLEETEIEAVSSETLEPAGEASHLRFHEQYIRPLEEITAFERRPIRPPAGIRSAIIWSEILGPPKGLKP